MRVAGSGISMAVMALTPWILAARPKTLPAAVAPVLLGSALAAADDAFAWLPALLCTLFALLVQIGTNYVNDYEDHRRGADTADRLGPTRAVASGLVTPAAMRRAAVLVFALAFLAGCGLLVYGGWWLLLVGVASLVSGWAYTGGPYPLGYHGWGDVFVFVFFGLIAVGFTHYVQAGALSAVAFAAGVLPGALATQLILVNNFRDRESDARAGKRTLAVRLGRRGTLLESAWLYAVAYAVPVVLWQAGYGTHQLWALATLPAAVLLWRQLARPRAGRAYNGLLARQAALLLVQATLVSGLLLVP